MTAVIVNFNNGEMIVKLVEKLVGFSNLNKVVVIDNNSTDGSLEDLKKLQSRKLQLIENQQNQGFAAAVNRGIKSTLQEEKGGYLLINPDVTLDESDISTFKNTRGEIVAPIIRFQRNSALIFDYGGRVNFLFGHTWHQEFNSDKVNLETQSDYYSGACLYITRKAIDTIGLFDEEFFMYFEDVDYCLRAKKAGLHLQLNLNIVVEHQISEHRFGSHKQKKRYLLRSNYLFIKKWIRWPFRFFALSYLVLMIVLKT